MCCETEIIVKKKEFVKDFLKICAISFFLSLLAPFFNPF